MPVLVEFQGFSCGHSIPVGAAHSCLESSRRLNVRSLASLNPVCKACRMPVPKTERRLHVRRSEHHKNLQRTAAMRLGLVDDDRYSDEARYAVRSFLHSKAKELGIPYAVYAVGWVPSWAATLAESLVEKGASRDDVVIALCRWADEIVAANGTLPDALKSAVVVAALLKRGRK